MKQYLLYLMFLGGCFAIPLSASELTTIENATLIDSDVNDGDSFMVDAGGRDLYLRLYYIDCLETEYNSKSDLERLREQQFHFGLEEPNDVVRFGEQATEYVKQVLSEPFTIHTSYANAPRRSASNRYSAFVETHDGQDLGYLLIEQGLARIHGKTRPSPNGKPSHIMLEELQSIPGIGPVTANKITAARPYRSVDDLLSILGIGPKTLQKITPFVMVKGE